MKITHYLIIILGILVGAEFFLKDAHHAGLSLLSLKGFHALLGMTGSIFLLFFAKFIGSKFLYRKESYYD